MKKIAIILIAIVFSSCEYLNQSKSRYYIGGDEYFQHGVDNVIINHTLHSCIINSFDGKQKLLDMRKNRIEIDSAAGELRINNITLYF